MGQEGKMRKTATLYVCLIVACSLLTSNCAVFVSSLPQVSSPLLEENLGYHPRNPHRMAVVNGTSFYASVAVYEQTMIKLNPGDSVYNTRRWELLAPQVPIMVRFYRDPELTDYVGAAGTVFQFNNGYLDSYSWTIRPEEITTPTGRSPSKRNPAVGVSPESYGVKFPRKWWNSHAGIQIVNNTGHDVFFRSGGDNAQTVKPAQLFYGYYQLFGFSDLGGQEVHVELIFLNHGRLVGSAERSFYVPSEGVYAYQWIVSASDIQR